MRHQDPIASLVRSAAQYAFADGLAEILIGVLLAASALFLPRAGILLAIIILLNVALPRLRARITAPRAGSAVLPVQTGRQLLGMAAYLAACGAILLAASRMWPAARVFDGYRWIPLLVGLALSGGLWYAARTTGFHRFYVYLVASVAGGFWFSATLDAATRPAGYDALRSLLLCLAALFFVTGGITLAIFLHRNPVVPIDVQHGSPQ